MELVRRVCPAFALPVLATLYLAWWKAVSATKSTSDLAVSGMAGICNFEGASHRDLSFSLISLLQHSLILRRDFLVSRGKLGRGFEGFDIGPAMQVGTSLLLK